MINICWECEQCPTLTMKVEDRMYISERQYIFIDDNTFWREKQKAKSCGLMPKMDKWCAYVICHSVTCD